MSASTASLTAATTGRLERDRAAYLVLTSPTICDPDEVAFHAAMADRISDELDRRSEEPAMTESSFFAPNTNYLATDPWKAPEIVPEFQCVGVAMHPSKGERQAFGFWRSGSQSEWISQAMSERAWAEGWHVNECPECCAPAVGNRVPEHRANCPSLDPHH